MLRSSARADPRLRDMARVNQLSRADKPLPRGGDLSHAHRRELKVRGSSIAAILGPFRFSWSSMRYSTWRFERVLG